MNINPVDGLNTELLVSTMTCFSNIFMDLREQMGQELNFVSVEEGVILFFRSPVVPLGFGNWCQYTMGKLRNEVRVYVVLPITQTYFDYVEVNIHK